MPRKYEKVQALLPEIKQLMEQGFSQREIADCLGLGSKKSLKVCCIESERRSARGFRNIEDGN